MGTQKQLAIALSKLKQIASVDRGLEQYQTDSELAAAVLWNAFMLGDIPGKMVYDLGCGNGIFGIGALYLEADSVVFVDTDAKAVAITNENIPAEFADKSTVLTKTIGNGNEAFVDEGMTGNEGITIIMNPPFGTKTSHADKEFLTCAFGFADVVYSIHLASSLKFLEAFSSDSGFDLDRTWEYDFGIKKSHAKHKKKRHDVAVVCVRFVKKR